MAIKDPVYWQKRQDKLQAENRGLRDKLAALKKSYRESQRTLRAQKDLFNAMPAGIFLIQQEKIAAVNETALEELGYQPEDCIGRHYWEFVHPSMTGFVRKVHRDRMAGKWAPQQYELDVVSGSGETYECDVRVSKVRYKGRKAFLSILFRRESRKRKEKELIRTQKMEAFRTMASGLNRQIGRNLEVINESIQGMREIGKFESPDVPVRLHAIEGATNRIAKTTRKLDVLAGHENGQSAVLSFDLKDVVHGVTSLVEPRLKDEAARRGVSLNLKTYQRSFSLLRGNPEEICDVIINMIMNAVDAMTGGGDIYLSTEEKGGYAYIFVQDSGEGIAERINGRILDPFFTTKGEGCIGLGLSLSYAIVTRHGGDMEVKSKKGEGTVVTIRLPMEKEEPEERPGIRRVDTRNTHILIIEGHHLLRELLSQVLEDKGYRTEKAISPLEGLSRLRKKPFDMLIADISAFGSKAEPLFKRVKKIDKTLPIVLISSPGGESVSGSLKGPGADLIVIKPLDMDQIVGQVSDLLIRHGQAT